MAFRLLRSRLSPLLRPAIPAALRRPASTLPRRPPDIVARARQLQNRRLWSYGLTISCISGFIVIVLANFQDYFIFSLDPTAAIAQFYADPSKRFRLGGLVLAGSLVFPSPDSPEMEFVLTDLRTDVLVRYEGFLPDLFKEGQSAVVEGFMRPFRDDEEGAREGCEGAAVAAKAKSLDFYFRGTEVLAKHDEKYMPKEVAEAVRRNKEMLKEQEASGRSG